MTNPAILNLLLRVQEEAWRYLYALGDAGVASGVLATLAVLWIIARAQRPRVRSLAVPRFTAATR